MLPLLAAEQRADARQASARHTAELSPAMPIVVMRNAEDASDVEEALSPFSPAPQPENVETRDDMEEDDRYRCPICDTELTNDVTARILHINPTSFQDQSTTPSRCDSLITLISAGLTAEPWRGRTEAGPAKGKQ